MTKPDALLVFGDSLSDAGEAYDLSGRVVKVPIPPDSAGYNGWFSNGLIQSRVTADLLAVPAEVYAVGGARAVGSRTVEQYLEENDFDTPEIMLANPDEAALATDTYLGGQLRHYLLDAVTNPPEPGTAAALWFGANDYNALPPDASPELVAQTIAAVVGHILGAAAAIAATGVGRTLLYNLPSPGFLPLPLPPTFELVVDAHNAALAQGAAFLASQGIDAEIVDMHRMAGEISADPRTFGLNPAYIDQPLLLGIGSQPMWIPEAQNWFIPPNPVVAGVDPSQVAFADLLHPSSATHGVLGSFVADFLTQGPRRSSATATTSAGSGRPTTSCSAAAATTCSSPAADRTPCSPGSATTVCSSARATTSQPAAPGATMSTEARATTWSRARTATTSRPAAPAATSWSTGSGSTCCGATAAATRSSTPRRR